MIELLENTTFNLKLSTLKPSMWVNFFVLLLLCWMFQSGYCQVYKSTYHLYISQDSTQSCSLEYDSCYTLSQLSQNSEFLSSINRLFINFSYGNHLLKSESFDILTFENASLVHMVGTSGPGVPLPYTTIECISSAGFLFRDIQDVNIINLSFIGCGGGPHVLNNMTRLFSALFFISLRTLTISNVSVHNSSGYGLYAMNIYQQVHVLGSTFLHNSAGNGMLVWNRDTECSNSSLTIMALTIENCVFAYGGSLSSHLLSAGGLRMEFNNLCGFGKVRMNAVKMLFNSAHQGGALSINFGPELKNGIDVSIDNCSFENGFAYEGGGIYLRIVSSYLSSNQLDNTIHQNFNIINSSVSSNTALESGGGIYISIEPDLQIHKQIITMSDTIILENSVIQKPDRGNSLKTTAGSGGGIFMSISSGSCIFLYEGMIFSINKAHNGGGMYLLYVINSRNIDQLLSRSPSGTIDFIEKTNTDCIVSSMFIRNQAAIGGGINVETSSLISYTSEAKNLHIHDVIFQENCGDLNAPAMGFNVRLSALHLELDHVTFSSNFILTFPDTDDILHGGSFPAIAANSPAALFVTGSRLLSIRDCSFTDNLVGGLTAFDSTLNISASIKFVNNTSINGGGMALYSSEIHLSNSTSEIVFEQNYAKGKGGAIYIDDHTHTVSFFPKPEHCFINMQANVSTIPDNPYKCTFVNNSAGTTGSVLYGGNLDLCNQTSSMFVSNCLVNQSTNFKLVQRLISSDPVQLCICENEEVLCDVRSINISTLPGEPFSISAIALGQRNGVTPAAVSLHFPKQLQLYVDGKLQTLPSAGCTNLTYTVFSIRSSEDMILKAGSVVHDSKMTLLNMSVNFMPCPKGFTLNSTTRSCKCAATVDGVEGITCNDRDYTIDRHELVWVGYVCPDLNSSFADCGIMFHKKCPYHYCSEKLTRLSLDMPNSICTGNRAGVLCGQCKEQYSMIFGSLECWDCENSNYLGLIVVFGLCGILLIALLTVLKLTISRGTINGLLYFAAVVQLNQTALFPSSPTDSFNFFTMFISWLNLDFGIKTCFYERMNPQAKLFLQLAFPLYIVILVLIIHLISRHSSRLSRLTGASHRVAISSTILLIAFLKILQVLVPVFPYTYITGSQTRGVPVWLYNGNVEYLGTEHLPLFIIAILLMLLVVLPFTCLLLFGQLLLRLSFFQNHYVRTSLKLRIIVDAYAGQTKVRSLSWMGIIVSTYIVQLVVFHSTGGEVYLNLVMAILGSCFLVGLSLLLGGMYKETLINILEWFIFLSIIVMASLTIQLKINDGDIGTNSSVFTTFSLLIFIGIICYHCNIEFSILKRLVKYLSGKRCSFKFFKLKYIPYVRYTKLRDHVSDEEDCYQSNQVVLTLKQDKNMDNAIHLDLESTNPNDWVTTDYPTPYFREHPDLLSSKEDNISTRSTEKLSSDHVRVKNISSSLLVIRHGEDDEADLIPIDADKRRKQTVTNDDDGVQTFVIEDSSMMGTRQSLHSPLSQKAVCSNVSSDVEVPENQREKQGSFVCSTESNLPSPAASISESNHSHNNISTSVKSNRHNFSYSKVCRRIQPRRLCQSNRNVRVKHRAQRVKGCTRLTHKNQSKLQNKVTLSTLVSAELLTSGISVLRVNSSGGTFHDKEQGISLKIPPGAIPTGVTAVIEIGILSHGPFTYSTSVTRVSPIIWICFKQPMSFKKNIAITLPHCLKDVSMHTCSNVDDLGLQFMVADHNLHPTSSKKQNKFLFTPLDCGSRSVFEPYTGTLTSSHCGFFCITANKTSPSFFRNVECCLTRIDPKPWCLETTVYFCVSYFLKACFQVLEKQFPKDSYEVKSKTCFHFAHSSGHSEPKLRIKICHDLSQEWLLVVESPGSSEISASELEFCSENEESLLLKQDCWIYPPRFHVRVSGSSARCSSSAYISFQGAVPDIGCGLLLPIIPPFSVHQGILRISGTPSRVDSTNSARFSSRHMDIIHEDQFAGLFYAPAWDDLDCLVVCKVATKWRDIGIQLRVSPERLDHIWCDNHHSGVQNMLREVLRQWSRNSSPPFQWAYIIRAMQAESVGEQTLAQELIEKMSLCMSYV